ncbi:phosphopantetheine-binding protein [Malacoplasma iowae]|uniref:Acyl carrier protein n=2 Tax=Malacoplasma iowae TaxID=2116 RepID=A0A084U479_MALIO|nr:phosphopantetheine-binding protein [Malacoplasma iowae]VEU62412.1 acyl carrier protein [Mycoplasmopsis fermentans]EGZ30899.1 acyl carrier protein [Malacoplasma iowae 695]KFB07765.1 acyl carrier protein [Malacoplasma iowae DK-CPA]QHG89770.1 phosphopantetheine-binding protein [Malacoplasma iowae 695]WPL35429.1 phosphopantetheine-binding protein [Malacoplasma iowae]
MNIKNDVIKIIKNELNIDLNEKKMGINFKEFGVDSLEIMELIIKIESEFDLSFPDDELLKLKTVNDLIGLIEQIKK